MITATVAVLLTVAAILSLPLLAAPLLAAPLLNTPLMNGEKLYSFAAAAKASGIPSHRGGGHVNGSTLWRWHRKGVRAANGELIHLRACQVGCKILTSLEAIAEFSQRLTEASSQTPNTSHSQHTEATTRARQRRVAARTLDAAGIK